MVGCEGCEMTRTYPDREATIALLTDWQKHHAAMDRLFKGFAMYVGLEVEGPMFETVYSLFIAYTVTLAVEVGDLGGWLEWHFSENDMGAGKMQAGYDGQLIAIESLGDLCRLIEISRERGAD